MEVLIISVSLCVLHMVLVLWLIGEDGASVAAWGTQELIFMAEFEIFCVMGSSIPLHHLCLCLKCNIVYQAMRYEHDSCFINMIVS